MESKLHVSQAVVTFFLPAVPAFAGLTADDIDAVIRVAVRNIGCTYGPSAGHPEIHEQLVDRAGNILQSDLHLKPGFKNCVLLCVLRLEIVDPVLSRDLKTPVLQSFEDTDTVTFIDLTGATAALDGTRDSGTERGQLLA